MTLKRALDYVRLAKKELDFAQYDKTEGIVVKLYLQTKQLERDIEDELY